MLVPRDTSRDDRLEEGRLLTPDQRLDRVVERAIGKKKAAGA
jgi:hypothetical protein